jgi:DNA-directed RNA polymerase specialized sigma54-like protein
MPAKTGLTADAQTAWNAITLAEVARSTGGHTSHVSRAIL